MCMSVRTATTRATPPPGCSDPTDAWLPRPAVRFRQPGRPGRHQPERSNRARSGCAGDPRIGLPRCGGDARGCCRRSRYLPAWTAGRRRADPAGRRPGACGVALAYPCQRGRRSGLGCHGPGRCRQTGGRDHRRCAVAHRRCSAVNNTGQLDRQARQDRRAFVRANHPDVGGDPEVFLRGLQAFGRSASGSSRVRVVAVRSHRPPVALVLSLWRRHRQRHAAPRVQ